MQKSPLLELEQLYQKQYVSYMDLEEIKAKYGLGGGDELEKDEAEDGLEEGGSLGNTGESRADWQSAKRLSKSRIRGRTVKLMLKLRIREAVVYYKEARRTHRYLNEREKMNKKFVQREQRKNYTVEGNRLDPQQIAAVVACEDAELILAPAGSGKTASLLAKLNYLTDVLKIPPRDILVIAFTNKVVAELNERVYQRGIEIRTFHSLGNKIMKERLDGFRLIDEGETLKFFRDKINELRVNDAKYSRDYERYFDDGIGDDPAAVFLKSINRGDCRAREGEEGLVDLMVTVLGLMKSENVSLDEYRERLERINDLASREKALQFYSLYRPVVEAYVEYMKRGKLYDFADMLDKATDMVVEMPTESFHYQYILVDEAQDLSTSKYLLLKAILAKCRKVKLFAVGDDWQSIYRFAGSNLRVLDDFEEIFGRETYRGMIELTYRFGQPTARISNRFIVKNPHQSRKKVVPHVKRRTSIEVRLSRSGRDIPEDYEAVNKIIQGLFLTYGEKIWEKKVQIISRYNRDIFRLVGEKNGGFLHARLLNVDGSQTEIEWEIMGTKKRLKVGF